MDRAVVGCVVCRETHRRQGLGLTGQNVGGEPDKFSLRENNRRGSYKVFLVKTNVSIEDGGAGVREE